MVAAGLCLLAVIAFYLTRYRPQRGEVGLRRDIPYSEIPVYAKAPVDQANFLTQPAVSKERILSGKYETVSDVKLLPDVVKEFYGIGNNSPDSGMANAGEEFNVSDAIRNDKLPSKRMIFAAVRRRDQFWIIQYEFGGRVHGYQVHFLTTSAESVEPVWRCRLDQPAGDIKTLLGKVDSDACRAIGQ